MVTLMWIEYNPDLFFVFTLLKTGLNETPKISKKSVKQTVKQFPRIDGNRYEVEVK